MVLGRRGLLLDVRSGSRRRLRFGAAPGGSLGCCGRGRCFRCWFHGCCRLATRRWSSGALWCRPSLGNRGRSRLRGFASPCADRVLQLGALLAQPGDGALQLDELRLEFRLVQLRRGGCCCLPGCRLRRACKRRCFRFSSGRRFVLRAERAAKALPGCGFRCTLGRGAGRLGASSHRASWMMNVLPGHYGRKKRLASCPDLFEPKITRVDVQLPAGQCLSHTAHDVQTHPVLSVDPIQGITRHFIRNAALSCKTSNDFGHEIYSIVCPTVISSGIRTSRCAVVQALDPSQARGRT